MRTLKVVIAITFCFVFTMGQGNTSKTDLSSLSWITGSWSGTQDGVELEEHWISPKGNTMLGLHRDVKGGKTVSFEFLRIDATPEGITYWASPQGRAATPFRASEIKDKRVVFENREHDFPQRVIYWLASDGMLHARIEGTLNGQAASEEWAWKRN